MIGLMFLLALWIGWTGWLSVYAFRLRETVEKQSRMLQAHNQEIADLMEFVGFDRIDHARRRGYWGELLELE